MSISQGSYPPTLGNCTVRRLGHCISIRVPTVCQQRMTMMMEQQTTADKCRKRAPRQNNMINYKSPQCLRTVQKMTINRNTRVSAYSAKRSSGRTVAQGGARNAARGPRIVGPENRALEKSGLMAACSVASPSSFLANSY